MYARHYNPLWILNREFQYLEKFHVMQGLKKLLKSNLELSSLDNIIPKSANLSKRGL